MTCNHDYSVIKVATGVNFVNKANPFLNGAGNIVAIFSAGASGAIIRSIIIKATEPTLTGMVRLYLRRLGPGPVVHVVLFKEVPVPIQPRAAAEPVPAPKYTMFEVMLEGGMKLQAGEAILASTENAQVFNIIVEAVDWSYPVNLPPECCNFEQAEANTGMNIINKANTHLDGTGTIVPIFIAGPGAGSRIKSITIKALQSTHEGVVRIFIFVGNHPYLMREVWIPQTTQSSYDPSFKHVIDMDFYLQQGCGLGASTENSESFAITVEAENLFFPI